MAKKPNGNIYTAVAASIIIVIIYILLQRRTASRNLIGGAIKSNLKYFQNDLLAGESHLLPMPSYPPTQQDLAKVNTGMFHTTDQHGEDISGVIADIINSKPNANGARGKMQISCISDDSVIAEYDILGASFPYKNQVKLTLRNVSVSLSMTCVDEYFTFQTIDAPDAGVNAVYDTKTDQAGQSGQSGQSGQAGQAGQLTIQVPTPIPTPTPTPSPSSSSELPWWGWLLIGLTIFVVIVAAGIFGPRLFAPPQ